MTSCLICGGEFATRGAQRFCGIACRNVFARSHFRPRVEKMAACRHCGGLTLTKGRTAPVCAGCRRRPCGQCGELFENGKLTVRFCSRFCSARWTAAHRDNPTGAAHPNWRGVARPYATHEWFVVRDHVRERDGWRCVDCGKARPEARRLLAHHLVSRADWGDRPGRADDAANLVTVCHPCHLKRHAATPEVLRQRQREQGHAYYLANREKALAQSRAWALANPEKVRETKRRSSARISTK